MAINIYLCIQNKLLTIDLLFHFIFIHSFVYLFISDICGIWRQKVVRLSIFPCTAYRIIEGGVN